MTLAQTLVAIDRVDPSSNGTDDQPDAPARYAARNRLIWQAVALAAAEGIPAGVGTDPAEPDWPVVYIELPGVGQVSWHLPAHPVPWDGHTTTEKRVRLCTYAAANVNQATGLGPAADTTGEAPMCGDPRHRHSGPCEVYTWPQ